MKKQTLRRSAPLRQNKPLTTIGEIVNELVVWDFGEDAYITRHNINQLAKALQMHYSLHNFGPQNFGLEPDDGEGY